MGKVRVWCFLPVFWVVGWGWVSNGGTLVITIFCFLICGDIFYLVVYVMVSMSSRLVFPSG